MIIYHFRLSGISFVNSNYANFNENHNKYFASNDLVLPLVAEVRSSVPISICCVRSFHLMTETECKLTL